MPEAVIVEAVRTPIARGKPGVGDLCDFHATELLALSYRELVRRAGLEYDDVDERVVEVPAPEGEDGDVMSMVDGQDE